MDNKMNLAISKNASTNLKVIFSLLVFIHHFAFISKEVYLSFFEKIGAYCVGIFFFLSGYGLMKSLATKGDSYLDTFFRKRIFPFLQPFFVAIFLFQVFQYFLAPVTFQEILTELSEGGTSHFLPFCWYIPVQLFFYLVFYFAVKGTRNNVVRMIVVFLLTVLYCLLVYYVGFNGHWIAPSFCFFFGCIYSFIDKKRVQLYYPIILLIIAGLTSKIRLVSSPLFCIGIAMLSDYLDQYTNEYLSKRFYHFYLAQGFSLILLVIVVPEINNNLLLCLGVSVLLQIVFTEILYRIDTFLKKI